MFKFVNVAGKYDVDSDSVSRNYKYISEEFDTLEEAYQEYIKSFGYAFNEIQILQNGSVITAITPKVSD